MKFFLIGILLVHSFSYAQNRIIVPAPSTSQQVNYSFGNSEVELKYSRLKLRGRSWFGEGSSFMAPYGKIWRTGANAGSFVTFSDDVLIQGKTLQKGTYLLVTWPGKHSWEISFYRDLRIGGQMEQYDPKKDALRIKVPAILLEKNAETMNLFVQRKDLQNGEIVFAFDNAVFNIPFQFTKSNPASSVARIVQPIGIDSLEINYPLPLYGDNDLTSGELTISDFMEFAGETVSPGHYTFSFTPGDGKLILQHSSGKSYRISTVRTFSEKKFSYQTNGLAIHFPHLPENNKTAYLQIDKGVYTYSVPVTCEYVNKVLDMIEKTSGLPNFSYYTAANFYFENNINLPKALEWAHLGVVQSPKQYWIILLKAKILYALEQFSEAYNVAKLALSESEVANNEFYINKSNELIRLSELKMANKDAVIVSGLGSNEAGPKVVANSANEVPKNIPRYALVIGVANYQGLSPLKNTLNDAQDIATTLRKLGFTVIEVMDPKSKRQMQDGIRAYQASLVKDRNAVGLVYYSGHGMQVDGSNYLLPAELDLQVKADVDDQCLNMDYVMAVMAEAKNPLNIFILDACRNNPFSSFDRSGDRGLSVVTAPVGSYIVYATKPGSVASDGSGRNGLFTSYLLKYITTPNLTIEQIFKNVARDVSSDSNNAQRPWISSDFTGDFYFSR